MTRLTLPLVSLLILLVVIAAPVATARAEEPALVGERGDPARMSVEGARVFSAAQIRDAIDGDVQAQVAAAPSARLDDFLDVLAERVRAGYARNGFPDARVSAAADDAAPGGGIIVRISEGPGYRGGDVIIERAGPVPAGELVRRLTSVRDALFFNTTFDADENMISVGMDAPLDDDADDVPWEAGTLADFDARRLRHMRKPVRRALAEMGFLWARFDLRLDRVDAAAAAPGPDNAGNAFGEARLIVTIENPGARAVLGDVKVEGLTRNTEAAVRELCGLADGMPLDVTVLHAVQQKLWDSARFKKHRLAARPTPGDPAKATLWLDLEELSEAPLLGEPFSDVEQALLRCRDYLGTMAHGPDDLAIELRGPTEQYDVALGFARGVAARMSAAPEPAAGGADARADGGRGEPVPWLAVRVEPGVATVFDPVTQSRFTMAAPGKVVVANLHYAPEVDEAGAVTWSLGFFTGLTDDGDDDRDGVPERAPVQLKLRLAPAGFIHTAHQPTFGFVLRDGIVESTAGGARVRIDAATGRPLHVETTTPDGSTLVVRAEAGGLRALADELAAGTTEAYEPAAPLGSGVRFVLGMLCRAGSGGGGGNDGEDGDDDEALEGEARLKRAGQALRNLLTPEVTAPLDRLAPSLRAALKGEHDGFTIPRTIGEGPAKVPGIVAVFALPYANDLFPRGSWPWTVTRELLMVIGGRPKQSAGEVARVFASPETGPLGYLVCAEALARADTGTAALFAGRGLRRLTAEDFARDWDALLGHHGAPEGDKVIPQFLARLVRRLGEAPQADVHALAEVLPRDWADALRNIASASRAARGEGGDHSDAALSKAIWDGWLGKVVEKRLNELSVGAGGKESERFVF